MFVDGVIPGELSRVPEAAHAAEHGGFDGAWSSEANHDPFFPLVLAAEHTEHLRLGTGIAVAFARNPMRLAHAAWDLQSYSQGRFMLGLGSQVKAHITRRFSMPWSHPAPRMRELILAIRAIWAAWSGERSLDFRGDFYTHTLMPPFFNPGPHTHGDPAIFLAGVGEKMTEVAGEVADGFLVHGFTTEPYLREVTVPSLEQGLDRSGRSREGIELSYPALAVTGADETERRKAAEAVKSRLAFYGSTAAYRGVLDHHGWGEAHTTLKQLSKEGRWDEMGAVIDDEMLSTFAIVAEPDSVAGSLLARFGGFLDRISLSLYGADDTTSERIREALQTA